MVILRNIVSMKRGNIDLLLYFIFKYSTGILNNVLFVSVDAVTKKVVEIATKPPLIL